MPEQQQIDLRQWVQRFSRSQQIIAIASIVLFIDMFIGAWLHVSADCTGIPAQFCVSATGGTGFNGWGWLTFLALVATILFFVVRKFFAHSVTLPDLPLRDAQVYMALGAVEVLGILLYWVEYHNDLVGIGWAWVVGIIAAAATIVGGFLMQSEPQAAAAASSSSYTPPPPTSYGAPPPPSSGG